MIGPLLALFSAVFFALVGITSRRAVIRISDATTGVFVTVFMAPPLLGLMLLSLGQIDRVGAFPWQSYLFLIAAGIIHFVIGRSMNFTTVQLLGANRANIPFATASLYYVAAGILLFRETLTWQVVSGAGLIMLGVMFMAFSPTRVEPEYSRHFGSTLKGMLLGLGSGLCYGLSPVMVKAGLGSEGSPLAGLFISCLGASAVMGMMLSNRDKRASLGGIERRAFWWFCVTGLCVVTAQSLRYFALSLSPLSIVGPLNSTIPLLTVAFSFVINRKLENFNTSTIVGAGAVVLGTIILL